MPIPQINIFHLKLMQIPRHLRQIIADCPRERDHIRQGNAAPAIANPNAARQPIVSTTAAATIAPSCGLYNINPATVPAHIAAPALPERSHDAQQQQRDHRVLPVRQSLNEWH